MQMETLLLSPESLPAVDSQSGAAEILQRLCSVNDDYRDLLGDMQNLELPSGVTLDDVLDAIVGMTVAHAIADAMDKTMDRGYGRDLS